MLCKKCMIVMEAGTQYHPKKGEKDKGYHRFYRCKKCGNKIFTKEPNFQECMRRELEK